MAKTILKLITTFLTILLIFFVGSLFIFSGRIYPGVKLANLNLAGQTREQTKQILSQRLDFFYDQPIKITYQNREWQLAPNQLDLKVDVDANIKKAYLIYRRRPYLFLNSFFSNRSLPIDFSYDQTKWQEFISKEIKVIEIAPADASLQFINEEMVVFPQIIGLKIDESKLKQDIENKIKNLAGDEIILSAQIAQPLITDKAINQQLTILKQLIGKQIVLKTDSRKWLIKSDTFTAWLELKPAVITTQISEQKENNDLVQLKVVFNFSLAENYLKTTIASEIEKPAKNALFKIEQGKVVAFALAQDGQTIDLIKLIPQIEQTLLASVGTDQTEVTLTIPLTSVKAQINSQNADDLGIKELIASGESDFTGSPGHRIHNIQVGASLFNGLLLTPSEEFSFNKFLGSVDAEHGFKPELVIKPDGVKPEFGGGLCQVSTTVFRAALKAGLPINERHNHSLLVSYYKPYGTDATIYPGALDLKFINDTNKYLLIQTRIIDKKLYFDFYGTSDGRKISITEPVFTSKMIDPGPPKMIETNTLAKGQKKQVEKSFPGTSTVFYRTVIYTDGRELKDTFASKYKPWKAVYLVGTKQ